jgi:hypothetical protein
MMSVRYSIGTARRLISLAIACRFLSKLEASVLRSRPLKVVTVRRRYDEDPDAALDRHFAAHPEDQDANVVIFHFLR